MADPVQTYQIRYSRWLYAIFWAIGMGRRFSRAEVGPDELGVRMGWGFRARIPRSAISGARRYRDVWWAVGVHGDLRFTSWLVNGSSKGIVVLDLEPPARGRTLGIPVKVKKLGIGLVDPEGFLATIGYPTGS
jgi:hypothetical protein